MPARGLLIALLLLTVPPQTQPRLPIHVESLVYPTIAYQARITGDVLMMALIDSEGHVSVPVLPPGHPVLVRAAEENIRTWRFQSGPESEVRARTTLGLRENRHMITRQVCANLIFPIR